MCFLALLYKTVPDYSVVVAANRDESPERPGTPPQQIAPGILAGVDPRAGGTWLGVTDRGLVAGVTNFVPAAAPAPGARSRGLLCLDALHAARADQVPKLIRAALSRDAYDEFNLLAADRRGAQVTTYAAGQLDVRQLDGGIHIIANGRPDDPDDPKVARGRMLIGEPTDIEQAMQNLPGVLRDDGIDPDRLDAICVQGDTYATLCSTIIAIHDRDPRQNRYLFADGNPRDREFSDLSGLLRRAGRPEGVKKD